MGEEMITTGVDDLIAYLKDKDRVAMLDVSTVLGIPLDTVQAWVDFLVEEKILGIEYKFTKPYIYINKEESSKKNAKIIEQTSVPIEEIKKEYENRARKKQIPDMKIQELWRSHVLDALSKKHDYFVEQVSRRRMDGAEELWKEYEKNLLARC